MSDLAARTLLPRAPFFHVVEGPESGLEPALAALRSRQGATVCLLDGRQAGTAKSLFKVFAEALSFPDYFGHNWDALDECLTDLEWLDSRQVVLVIHGAGGVLPQEPDDLEILVEILITTAEAWAEAGTPAEPMSFHVVLQDTPEALAIWREALETQAVTFERWPC